MPTFNNGDSGISIRNKLNEILEHIDDVGGALDVDIEVRVNGSRVLTTDDSSDYATAAQGALADSALQSESDTLDSVTDRGATTTNAVTVGELTVSGQASVGGSLAVTGPVSRVGAGFSNFDTAFSSISGGIYEGTSGFQPTNFPGGAGNYFHVRSMTRDVGGALYIQQVAYTLNANRLFMRSSTNGGSTWSAWVEK